MAVRGGLKKWKDSAGVILISGAFKYARPPTPISTLVNLGENPLIVPLDELDSSGREWTLTLVKRGSKTGFYANTYVFPGGRIDQSDSSPRWLELFRHCSNLHSDPFQSIMTLRDHSSNTRLPIYEEVPKGPIEGEIALRICAIRELFEEAGVLLARDNKDVAGAVQSLPGTIPPAVKALTTPEMNHWRGVVHNNPEEFLNLCSELECVPDIWGLLEWSDWLTPRNLPIRYDTLFYVCFIETQPPVKGDGEEIVDAQWLSPSEAIQLYLDRKIQITPPQFAEVNILRSLGPVPCLHSYALRTALKGSVSRSPTVRILTKDKVLLSLMNTDDIYPALSEEEALTSPPPHPPRSPTLTHIPLHPSQSRGYEYECHTHTADELRDLCTNLCRMEFHGEGKFFFYDNVISDKVNRHMEDYYGYRKQSSKL